MRDYQRIRDSAFILPFLGLFLFLPPMLSLFDAPLRVLGIPLIQLYIFSAWLILVIAAWAITKRLAPYEEQNAAQEASQNEPGEQPADNVKTSGDVKTAANAPRNALHGEGE